ncbi:MAG: CRTAC1 family protein, partial [Planctomycetes bacterium]|nr:CRTAC1 family protein [Planctomycetota bacterium]
MMTLNADHSNRDDLLVPSAGNAPRFDSNRRSAKSIVRGVLFWGMPIFLLAGLLLVVGVVQWAKSDRDADRAAKSSATDPGDVEPKKNRQAPSRQELLSQRQELNETVWAKEVLAQKYEATLVRLWDDLLKQDRLESSGGHGDKFAVFEKIPLGTVKIAKAVLKEKLDWDIERYTCSGNVESLDHAGWVKLIQWAKQSGLKLVQSEWHHAAFEPADDGSADSTVSMLMHFTQATNNRRIILRGKLKIHWSTEKDDRGNFIPQSIDATGLEMLTRTGEVPFTEMLTVDPSTPQKVSGIHPLIVYDLDGDGRNDLLLGGCNRLYRNMGGGRFEQSPLCKHAVRTFEVGLVADFNGDGRADYMAPSHDGVLLLFLADVEGRFTAKPLGQGGLPGRGPFQQPQAMTAGDIDGDGDLDVWIGQYKISYLAGQMPTPYYDANDGYPAYLLLNDGAGRFTPHTEQAGLAPKRNRRSYTSSFVDLDDDGDLDLLVVSDFSGIDIYHNDGKGYFTDVTDRLVDDRHLFGMSATFGDYNLDGRLDFFVSGMASTTARRLELMKAGRRDRADIHLWRSRMGYGNRMYVAAGKGFRQPDFRDSVARTGWAWGTTSPDFDNDGDRDIYVANGHSSGKSTKDHCTHFWCHDIYDSTPKGANPAIYDVFKEVHKGYLDRTESWDGYQKNVLLMNLAGKEFISIGFLMGVAKQYDARAAISADLDGDGRLELLVVEDNWKDGQVLHVYRNRLQTGNHWIGVRLKEEGGGRSPVGAKITVYTANRKHVGQIITGESIHAQHAPVQHFGLGRTT